MAVVEASAPSTSAFTPALLMESSNHSNVRAETFSDLIEEVNGVEVTCVQAGSLIPAPSLGGTAVYFYTGQTISSPFVKKGLGASTHLSVLPFGIVVEPSPCNGARLLIVGSYHATTIFQQFS